MDYAILNSIMFEPKTNEDENYIENLQEEMLVQIFKYLSAKDLKCLLLTSRYFHNVIISSLKLMKKIILKFNYKYKIDYDCLTTSARKYQRLRIVESTVEDSAGPILKHIPHIQYNIIEVEFRGCKFKKEVLTEILRNLPDLKKFTVTNTIIENLSDPTVSVELRKLTTIKISHSNFSFDVLQESQNLRELIIDLSGLKANLLDIRGFDEFFVSQNKLEVLQLTDLFEKDDVFETNIVNTNKMQLKMLTISQCFFKNVHYLESFIRTQNSIEYFELTVNDRSDQDEVDEYGQFADVLGQILRLKSLKTINLEFTHLNPIRNSPSFFVSNENVTSLVCNTNNMCSERILRLFPKLQHLELRTKFIADEQVDFLNQYFEKLESLKVVNFPSESFQKLKLKSLQAIEIYETNIEPACWDGFIKNNPNIKKLIINYAFFMEMTNEVIDLLTKKFKRLEHFELVDKYIGTNNDIYKTICENCPNLKFIKLHNINIEENFSDDDKNYLKQRGIKFDLYNDVSLSKVCWIF